MEPITEISDAERIDCFQEYTYPDWFVDATSILTKMKEKLGDSNISFEVFPEDDIVTVMLMDNFSKKKNGDNYEATIIEMDSKYRETFVNMCKRIWKNYSASEWSDDFFGVLHLILMTVSPNEKGTK